MKELIEKLDEVYQDIELHGEVLAKGVRECAARWNCIMPRIGPHDVVMDIGSSTGYFAIKTALTFPDSLVISFESDPASCAVQREILKREGIYNVVLCRHRLTLEDMQKWAKCVEAFDVILALSVMHHFDAYEVNELYSIMRCMAPHVIWEVADPNEELACGTLAARWAAFDKVTIGSERVGVNAATFPSHLGSYERYMKDVGLFWGAERSDLDAYLGVAHDNRNKFDLSYVDRYWRLNGQHMIKGVNLWNLLPFDIQWPHRQWWLDQAGAAYSLWHKSDIRLWNLLVTSTGLKAIDYQEEVPKDDQRHELASDIVRLQGTIIGRIRE